MNLQPGIPQALRARSNRAFRAVRQRRSPHVAGTRPRASPSNGRSHSEHVPTRGPTRRAAFRASTASRFSSRHRRARSATQRRHHDANPSDSHDPELVPVQFDDEAMAEAAAGMWDDDEDDDEAS